MLKVLEELPVFTPLGIRFWDSVLDVQVRGGLAVSAWSASGLRPVVQAYRSRSDVYSFHRLPGLLAVEYALPEADADAPERRPYVVEVRDRRRHFLPLAFRVELPLPYRGLFPRGDAGSPPASSPRGFPLFSAPTRPPAPWLAVVRGELRGQASGRPAAHALVQVEVEGESAHYGLADAAGRFAVFLPQPTLAEGFAGGSPPIGSPPGEGRVPLSETSWELAVTVFWEPARLVPLPGTSLPDLASVFGQRQATVWLARPEAGGSEAPAWHGQLRWARECIVTTDGESQLLLSATAPSP